MVSRSEMYPKRAQDISHLNGYYPLLESAVTFYSEEGTLNALRKRVGVTEF
jgi:hypothetical protein